MKPVKIIEIVSMAMFLLSCAQPKYLKENVAYIVWETPNFRYADQGFVYESPERIMLEIYGNGHPLMRLKIGKEQICANFIQCMDKKSFNKNVLSGYYPKELLENILHGKVIFAGRNLTKKRNGFTQSIHNDTKYDIRYTVLNNEIRFSDTINKIKIKVIKQ